MSDLPPLPNVFAIDPGMSVPYETFGHLGYEEGKNITIWKTSEHVCDFVEQGGFRRAAEDLTHSLHKWMSETPSPQVLICCSRGARLVSRLLACEQAIPPLLAVNGMLYYLFLQEDQWDTLFFNHAGEIEDVLLQGARDFVTPIPASIAPRTILAASPGDATRRGHRFMPDDLLRAAAQRLHDVHVYYNESDTHRFSSLWSHERLGALLRLAAHGNPAAIPATYGVVDTQLQKGASVCGLLKTSQEPETVPLTNTSKQPAVKHSGL